MADGLPGVLILNILATATAYSTPRQAHPGAVAICYLRFCLLCCRLKAALYIIVPLEGNAAFSL
jgi:hypothetical protein